MTQKSATDWSTKLSNYKIYWEIAQSFAVTGFQIFIRSEDLLSLNNRDLHLKLGATLCSFMDIAVAV